MYNTFSYLLNYQSATYSAGSIGLVVWKYWGCKESYVLAFEIGGVDAYRGDGNGRARGAAVLIMCSNHSLWLRVVLR